MSHEINVFKKAKADLAQAKSWSEKVGQTYYGGTSGKGEPGRITGATVNMTVYHQPRDGDNNYHDAPEGMKHALAEVLIEQHAEIFAKAIALMQSRTDAAAKAAAAAHELLMQEAGLL